MSVSNDPTLDPRGLWPPAGWRGEEGLIERGGGGKEPTVADRLQSVGVHRRCRTGGRGTTSGSHCWTAELAYSSADVSGWDGEMWVNRAMSLRLGGRETKPC